MTATVPCPHNDAIKAVIARETETFVARDWDGWAACWVQDTRTREVCMSSTHGAQILQGWDQLSAYMKAVFDAGAVCQIEIFDRSNWNITRSGDIAHVTFDGRSVQTGGRVEATFETRTLERSGGAWRILYTSFVVRGHQSSDDNRLAVDEVGQVLCAPETARAILRHHTALCISHGRLRAAKPAWDKVLQAVLRRAAEQHGYFQHYRYETQHGHQFRLPVVLGETDDGGVSVCVLFVRDGMTFVEMDNATDIAMRVKVAGAIYGLSDGQMALARRIVGGDGVTMAADALGISVNTARTHLSRIYGKTGINSQTALVRTLLSVG